MARLLDDNLDAYARFALPLILARFPAWEQFGLVQPRPDSAGGSVEFTVPCPSQAVKKGLWISTADEELTVGFHTDHRHFTDYDNRLNPKCIEDGLDLAAAYLADRCGVASWYKGEWVAATSSTQLPLDGPLPRPFSKFPVTHVTLRSWSGLFDRDERIT